MSRASTSVLILAGTLAAGVAALGCGDAAEHTLPDAVDAATDDAAPPDAAPPDVVVDPGDASSKLDAPPADAFARGDAAASADIELVSIQVSPDPPQALEVLDCVVSVENHGPDSAPHLLITFQLPKSVVLLGGKDCTGGAGFGQCSLGELAPGAAVSTTAFLSAKQAGPMPIHAVAGGGIQDADTDNNAKSLTLLVE